MKNNNRTRRGKASRQLVVMDSIAHPPQILPQIKHRQRLRFVTNVAISANAPNAVATLNLLDAILIATTATQGYQLFDAVKVHLIELWAPPSASLSTPVTCGVSFPGNTTGDAGDGRIIADTSVSVQPAHVVARPQKLSAAAMWQGTASGFNVFSLFGPTGMVVDVECLFRNADTAPAVVTNALVAATTGQLYYRGLDGLAIAGTKFVPQASFTA
jgi:hypothetical protein